MPKEITISSYQLAAVLTGEKTQMRFAVEFTPEQQGALAAGGFPKSFCSAAYGDRHHIVKEARGFESKELVSPFGQRSTLGAGLGDRIRLQDETGASCLVAIERTEIQRVQDISRADAIAEGMESVGGGRYWLATPGLGAVASPEKAYRTFWESTESPESWNANPWVWAISFRVVRQ